MIKIYDSSEINIDEIVKRNLNEKDVSKTVKDIIEDVKQNGDAALKKYSLMFDKAEIDNLRVTEEEIEEAWNSVDDEFKEILTQARNNIYAFHKEQKRKSFFTNDGDGIILGEKIIPLERAGLYIPGGTAAYPSTVLMNVTPAKIAGVNEVVMVTPPDSNGKINKFILAAAKVAGVDEIYKVGGAQAVAALAYGTESIRRVDKITGPGNVYVAEAKRQVFGLVSIDMVAGPSEVLILADETTNYRFAASDLLAQAEHDVMATPVLITTSKELAEKVQAEVELQVSKLPRESIARTSVDNNGKAIVTKTKEEAIEIANAIAPEHLEICFENPFDYVNKIKNAGSIFVGEYSAEVLGDYFAGPNHTLPTNGTARFSSPVSVDDFIKKSQILYYSKEAFEKINKKIAYFANVEGLDAHAASALIRTGDEK